MTCAKEKAPPSVGAALCVLSSRDVSSHMNGTRVPSTQFSTPFKSASFQSLIDTFEKDIQPRASDWSRVCFAILDERSVKDNTLIVVVTKIGDPPRSFRCDFWTCLDQMNGYEQGTLNIRRHIPDLLGGQGVFTLERWEKNRANARNSTGKI